MRSRCFQVGAARLPARCRFGEKPLPFPHGQHRPMAGRPGNRLTLDSGAVRCSANREELACIMRTSQPRDSLSLLVSPYTNDVGERVHRPGVGPG